MSYEVRGRRAIKLERRIDRLCPMGVKGVSSRARKCRDCPIDCWAMRVPWEVQR